MKYINKISKLKLLEFLNRINLFKSLTPKDREAIASLPNLVALIEKDSTFIKKNEYDSSFYIILNGEVMVMNGEKVIATVGDGHFVGEVGFICNEPRSATVKAKVDVIALKITKELFDLLPIKVREGIKEKIIAGLVTRVATQNTKISTLENELETSQKAYFDLQEQIEAQKLPLKKQKT